jgi:hypothetical protein
MVYSVTKAFFTLRMSYALECNFIYARQIKFRPKRAVTVKVRTEVHLSPQVKYGFHRTEFHETQNFSVNYIENLCTEFHRTRSRIWEVRVEIHLRS